MLVTSFDVVFTNNARTQNENCVGEEKLTNKIAYNFYCLNSNAYICVTCRKLKCLLSEPSISIVGKWFKFSLP